MTDLRPFLKSKSDQLNADDLSGGDVTAMITDIRVTAGDQPVAIVLDGGHCPWKPCKTGLRQLAAAWGQPDRAESWIGRWVRLYRDSSVRFGGDAVGGIRVRALSHLEAPVTISLAETRGKKRAHKIAVLRADECRHEGAATANLDGLLTDLHLTTEDVDRWLASAGRPSVADLSPKNRAALAAALASDPEKVEAIRALIPAPEGK